MAHGHGIRYGCGNWIYDGQWEAGLPHGTGVSFHRAGTKSCHGQWKRGDWNGVGTAHDASGHAIIKGAAPELFFTRVRVFLGCQHGLHSNFYRKPLKTN